MRIFHCSREQIQCVSEIHSDLILTEHSSMPRNRKQVERKKLDFCVFGKKSGRFWEEIEDMLLDN